MQTKTILQCKKCGSKNTETVSAKELSDKTGDETVMSAAVGNIDPAILIEAITEIFKTLGKLFGFMKEREKNSRTVFVCKDCGYWEKI